MAILIDPWYWTAFGTIYTFWVLILPAIPIQLLLIALYAGVIRKIKGIINKGENK